MGHGYTRKQVRGSGFRVQGLGMGHGYTRKQVRSLGFMVEV